MKKITRILLLVLAVTMIFSFAACSAKKDDPETDDFETVELKTEEKTEEEKTEETKEEPAAPSNVNPLTGLACDPSLVGQRPIGVMLNNIKEALPQIGISNCDILYEVKAEGGIVRFEGLIFDYAKVGNLGSIRSARTYYVNLARANDVIFVHAGASSYANTLIAETNIDHFDGVRANFYVNGKPLYWRDQNRLNSGYATEHTMFSNGADIAAAIEQKGIRKELKDPSYTAFKFDPKFESLGSGKSATYIRIPQSNYYLSEFNYDATTGLYGHKHYGVDHIDGGTGEQIKFTNVFVLFVKEGMLDDNYHRDVTLTGEGKGYYANGGEYIEITWKHASHDEPFRYYTADGKELKVETGKSYISIFDVKNADSVTFS